MQRMLIDHLDPGVRLHDQIPIMHLQRILRQPCEPSSRAAADGRTGPRSSCSRARRVPLCRRCPISNGRRTGSSNRCSRSGSCGRHGATPASNRAGCRTSCAALFRHLPPQLLLRPVHQLARARRCRRSASSDDSRRPRAGVAPRACRSVVKNFVRSVPKQQAIQPPRILEPHFLLRRMHVHIHQVGRHLQPQEANRLPARQQQAAIRLAQRVLQRRSRIARPFRNKYCIRPVARLCIGLAT